MSNRSYTSKMLCQLCRWGVWKVRICLHFAFLPKWVSMQPTQSIFKPIYAHICTNCITLRPPACPIGLILAKCFINSAVGMYKRCGCVYIWPTGRNWSPCHPHSWFSSQFTRTSAHVVHSRTIGVPACPIGHVPAKALSALPLGCIEGAYMFTFGLLAEIGLHATHTVDFQANFRAHLRTLYTLKLLEPLHVQ
jgi:hypothetical protein